MRNLFLFIVLNIPFLLCAQKTEQKGWVTKLNSGKQALPGVQIEFDDAPSTTSDDGGKFVLTFLEKKYGDIIFMSAISKLGFELVNEKELQYPTLSSNQIKIVLCEKGLLDQMRTEYYNLSKEAFNKGYQEQLQRLKFALKEKRILEKDYASKVTLLQEQLMKSEERVTELSEKYARTNFDNVSAEYRQAFEQFKTGNLNETLAILDKVNLPQRLKKRLTEKQRIQSLTRQSKTQIAENELGIKQDMQAMKLAADMYILKMDFNKANDMYANLVALDSTSIDNTLAYANFCYRLRKFKKAHRLYQKTLSLSEKQKDEIQIGNCLYGLGNLLIEAQNTTAALPYTQRAISHYKKLVDNYSALFLINLASNQLNLGIIYNRQDNHNASIESYSSTLKSLALVKQNHEVFKCSLVTEEEYKNLVNYYTALAHTNLGIIYIETDQVEKAYSNLNKSLLLSRSLAKKTKQKYLDIHISTLKNMGLYYTSKNNYNKALEYYKQALQHLQSYSKINRHENKNLLARTYQSIGNLFYKMHNYPLAEKNELKALELLRELSAANPSIYSAEQKQILQDLACVYMKLEDYEKVKLYGKEFIQLQGKSDTLTKNNLENLQVHNFLATLYIGQEEYEKSLDYLQQGLIIAKNLATIRPEKYKIQIAKAYNNLGVVYKGMENFEKSIENWEKALVLYDELSSENPDKYLLDLAQSSKNLGFTYSQVFKFKEAIKLNQKALESYQQLAKTQSKSFEVDVISCLQTLIAIHINSYLESKDPNTLTTIKHRFEQTDLLHKKQQNNPNLAPYRNHLKALKNYLNHLLLSNKEKIHFLKEDINKTKNQSVDKKSLSEKYAQLAWYYLLENDAQSANTNSQTALSYHPCLHANIAHAFSRLISGEFQKAQATLDIYIKEPYPQDYRYKTCKELYLAQIKELEQVGISHPNLGKMKSYLLQN